jgi:hypothetical protein
MIISFSKKFVFFRPKKVGSTTIEFFLSNSLLYPDIWITDKIEDIYFYNKNKIKSKYYHYTGKKKLNLKNIFKNLLIFIKKFLGYKSNYKNLFSSKCDDLDTHSNPEELFRIIEKKLFKNFMIISVIRNPFEQIISYAYHKAWQKGIGLSKKNEIKVINEIVLKSHKKFFNENKKFLNYPKNFKKIYFIKLENLDNELKKISKILGIKYNYNKKIQLRSNLRNRKFKKKNLTKNTINDLNKNVNFKEILKLGNYKN